VNPCVGKNNFIKKGRVGKKFSWMGEKNTLLKKMLAALACAFFKSVFFCALAFLSTMMKLIEIQ
jgi:hypothetical protein